MQSAAAIAALISLLCAAAALQPQTSDPPVNVDVSGDLELSASRVRRDTEPDREVILTLVTVAQAPAARAPKEESFFVLEDEGATGTLLPRTKGPGRVTFKGGLLTVTFTKPKERGWLFVPRRLKASSAGPAAGHARLQVESIRRYLIGRGSFARGALEKQLFSGKVKR